MGDKIQFHGFRHYYTLTMSCMSFYRKTEGILSSDHSATVVNTSTELRFITEHGCIPFVTRLGEKEYIL